MITLVLGALLFGCLLPALVGWLGSRRELGFGWTFLISLIFTPLVGLIFVLLSPPLPAGSEPKMGCIGGCLSLAGLLFLGFVLMMGLALLLMPL
ncbi:MAG: hypothetical protein E7137_06800 [Rikenellaceae bacterium]|nr:hypothetical protein [Rikenellaceae bacterium]